MSELASAPPVHAYLRVSGHTTVRASSLPGLPSLVLPVLLFPPGVSFLLFLWILQGLLPCTFLGEAFQILCFLAGRTNILSSLVSIAFHNISNVVLKTMHVSHLRVPGSTIFSGTGGGACSAQSPVPSTDCGS